MNKETLKSITNEAGKAGCVDAPVGSSFSKAHLHGNPDHDALDKASWILDSYLRALDVPIQERIKLCNETVDSIYTHKSLGAIRWESSQMIRELSKMLADEWQVDSNVHSVRDPILASTESRLLIWLTAGSMHDRQHLRTGLESQNCKLVEIMVATPSINRAHMPTVKLQFNPIGRVVGTVLNALMTLRSLAVQSVRRHLMGM